MNKKSNEKAGGDKDFTLVSSFTNGYRNREDVTVLPPGVLVTGSQNVLTNTFQRIGIRKGYTLDGQANTDLAPIGGNRGAMGVYDWQTSSNGDRHMRCGFLTDAGNDGKMQYRYVNSDGVVTWNDLITDLTSIDFNFVTFWDEDTLQSVMLAVNGESNIRYWNGALGVLASSTAATAGVIETFTDTPGMFPAVDSGGVDYVVGDQLTVTGGNGDAILTVITVAPGAIRTLSINAAGTGYAPGDTVTISGAGGAPHANLTVLTVGGSGEILTFSILENGVGYTIQTGVTTTSSPGTGFTVNVTAVGDSIVEWGFASDADRGSGYSVADNIPLTGGSGTNAKLQINSVSSGASGSLTVEGTKTLSELGFTTGVTGQQHQLIINGNTYNFPADSLLDTNTFFGVTPDPSGEPIGSIIAQAPQIWANEGGSDGLPLTLKNDLIGTLNARVFIGSLTNSFVYISDFATFKTWQLDIAFLLTNAPTAFIPQEDSIYISGGHDEWYNISFKVSADLTTQVANIDRLNTTAQQAAQSQVATNKIANSVAYLSFEPIINSFGPVENILTGVPQITDFSFPIINDMNTYNFSNAAVFYFRKFIYVAVPREGLVLVYNMTDTKNPYWETPQVLPISRFSIIDGELYGHSSQVSESYKLFNGTNDNGNTILSVANFSFNNYGTRTQSKGYNQFYVEGYISANTTLELGIQFDIDGCATRTSFEIDGTDTQIVCIALDLASLGKTSLGKQPLGGQLIASPTTPKFRVIKTFPLGYFYEDQISFSSEELDAQWEVIGFGPQLVPYGSLNNNITQ